MSSNNLPKDIKPLNLFISYSHLDEESINIFHKHITPLKDNHTTCWHDRKLLAGDKFQEIIDAKLNVADIICLFISHNFISSPACKKEMKDAITLKNRKGIRVVPIILSSCAWLDVLEISEHLVIPTDGKPISEFTDQNCGWTCGYTYLKECLEHEKSIKQLNIRDDFSSFLNDTEMLTKAHSKKETVFLSDIYVFPQLLQYDIKSGDETDLNEEKFTEAFFKKKRIIIKGDDQSGKTSFLKMLYQTLFELSFIPIYLKGASESLSGKMNNILEKAFNDQYEGVDFYKIDSKRIVPLIDDFYKVPNKENVIERLSEFTYTLLAIDFETGINIRNSLLLEDYIDYRIQTIS